MKKVWACLIACAVVLSMLPGMTVKAADVVSYELRVGNTNVTSQVLSGEGWSYEPDTKTLTLDGFTCRLSKKGTGVIYSYGDLNLVLKNENNIENLFETNGGSGWHTGIEVSGTLTISGSGRLEVSGGKGYTSHGISVSNLIVNGGTISATGKDAEGSSGIYVSKNITINRGNITATANTSQAGTSRGIECEGTFIQNGGKVTATAGKASSNSYGLQAGDIQFNAGAMNLTGETAAYYSKKEGKSSSKTYEVEKTGVLASDDFTFKAPADLIYDGQEKAAAVTAKSGVSCGAVTVKYYDASGNLLTGLPKETGNYTVKIDVDASSAYQAAENLNDDSWKFQICYGSVTEDMYTVTGIREGWAKGNVTLCAADGYEVGTTPDTYYADFDFSGSGEKEIYIRNKKNKKVYTGTIKLIFKKDTISPVCDGLTDGKTYYNTNVRFTAKDGVTSGEDQSGIAEVKDGDSILIPAADGTYTLTTDGTHKITVTDKAGNRTTITVILATCKAHRLSDVKYEWSDDNAVCSASGICDICNEKITETVQAKEKVTQEQSCTKPELTEYTVTFKNSGFATQTKQDIKTKDAAGHTPNADDGDCTTVVTCKNCDYVFVQAKVHDFSGEWKKDTSGHWKICQNEGCTKTDKKVHVPNLAAPTEEEDQICRDCGWLIADKLGHIHKLHLEKIAARAANCTEGGNKAYYRCTEDKKCFADENAETEIRETDMTIVPSGHAKGNPVYTWNKDNTKCTAVVSCKNCQSILEKETVQSTAAVTQKQSAAKPEITTYTAAFSGKAFTVQTKKVQTKTADAYKANGLTLNDKFALKTGKTIKVSWGKVKGADGYDVYMAYCGSSKFPVVKSTKAASVSISKLNKKAINQKKSVKCYVAAYKLVNGKKQKIGETQVFHATGSKNKTTTVAKAIKVNKTAFVLKAGKTAALKASITKKDKKLPLIAHTAKFRYATSDSNVAVVSKNGKITAKAKGNCYVYVYAVNGCAKKVKVTVK